MQIRCPHCQNSIETVEGDESFDYNCGSCGSHFNLAQDLETLAQDDASTRSIGHFELVDKVGMGAFGTVYKALDSELDRSVAVKIPRQSQLDGPQAEQFLREARAAAQLKHPNIVSVHEVGRQDGTLYIVSDFVEGLSLADRLTGQKMARREAVELCVTVAEALEHAHQQGVTHRDLKPSNIMLDDDGQPHIMDFGLAKRDAGEITMTVDGKVLGTPAYMPPEQAKGEGHAADARSDVYSLGVILFELLTGELPFRGNQRMLLHQVIHEEAPSPRKLNSSLPRDLETITLKCLRKDASGRYQTAQELADDLSRWINKEPIAARPTTWMGRSWRWCRRKPAVAGLTAMVVLSLVGGTVVSTSLAVQASRNAEDAEERRQQAVRAQNREAKLLAVANEQADEAEQARGKAETQRKRADFAAKAATRNARSARTERLAADKARKDADKARDKAERRSYISDFSSAQYHWDNANIGPIREALERTGRHGDHIGFEWHYWDRHISGFFLSRTLRGWGRAIAFSPDGSLIVTSSTFGPVNVWNATTGEHIQVFSGHTSHAWDLAFSPDGQRLAAGCRDRKVYVWDVDKGKKPLILDGHKSDVYCVAFSKDGKTLATGGGDRTIRMWNASTGQESGAPIVQKGTVRDLVFSPSGEQLVSGSRDGAVTIWSLATRRSLKVLRAPDEAEVYALAFRPDGEQLASAGSGGGVYIWNMSDYTLLRSWRANKFTTVRSLAYIRDGRLLASASADRTIEIRYPDSGSIFRIIKGHASDVVGIAVNPNGTRIASVSRDQTMKIWPVADPFAATTGRHSDSSGVLDINFSHDGQRIASAGQDKTVKIWETKSRQLLRTLPVDTAVYSVDFSPDDQLLACTEGSGAKLWDVEEGTVIRSLQGHKGIVRSVRFSPDGLRVATCGTDSTARMWDTKTGRELWLRKDTSDILYSVAFSPDGKVLASAGRSNLVLFYDAETGKELQTPNRKSHPADVYFLEFSPDGTELVTTSGDRVVRLWNAETGRSGQKLPRQLLVGHKGTPRQARFSADGKRIVSPGWDGVSRVWDAETGAQLARLPAPEVCWCIAIHPSGRQIVVGGKEGSIWSYGELPDRELTSLVVNYRGFPDDRFISPDIKRIASTSSNGERDFGVTDVATGKRLLLPTDAKGRIISISFAADGKHLATADSSGSVKVWDCTSGALIRKFSLRRVFGLAFSPDGSQLAATGFDGSVTLWAVVTGEKKRPFLSGQPRPLQSVRFSPDGKWIAVGAISGRSFYVWNVDSRELVLTAVGRGFPERMCFSSDSRRFACATDKPRGVLVWDLGSGREILSPQSSLPSVISVRLSPDGEWFAASYSDGKVRIWDVQAKKQRHLLDGHTGRVVSVRFSPDGTRIASASSDKTIKVWETASGKELLTLRGHSAGLRHVNFGPNGQRLVSFAYDKTVKVWDVSTPTEGN